MQESPPLIRSGMHLWQIADLLHDHWRGGGGGGVADKANALPRQWSVSKCFSSPMQVDQSPRLPIE